MLGKRMKNINSFSRSFHLLDSCHNWRLEKDEGNRNKYERVCWTYPRVVYIWEKIISFQLNSLKYNLEFSMKCLHRAHHNDMENILPYLSVGLFYVLTNPNPMVSTILFRVATIARFAHTFVYAIYVIPQPARAICFFIQYLITLYMAFMCVIFFI